MVYPLFELSGVCGRYFFKANAFRIVSAYHFILIFVRAPLVSAVRVAIIYFCAVANATAALLESLSVGKLGAVVYRDTLKHFVKVCTVCTFYAVKSFNNACSCMVFHNAYNFVAGITLGKYKHSFFSTFFALYAIHFPMPESRTLRNLCGAFLYAFAF